MIANIRLFLAFGFIALVTVFLLPIQLFALKFDLKLSRRIPLFWHRMILRVFGIKVHVSGKFTKNRPLMIIANHISWKDILVLGSVGELCFISKHEIGELPGASFLARMQRTIFIVRDNKRDVAKQTQEITDRMVSGDPVVLFAEGTTGDGHKVLEFKSSLFGATQNAIKNGAAENVVVQPVAISYTKLHGMPAGRTGRSLSAWTGDMGLTPHVFTILKNPAWDVEVQIGTEIKVDATMKRREIAILTRNEIRRLFNETNYGRKHILPKQN